MRDEEQLLENIRLQAERSEREVSAVESQKQRKKEIESLSKRYNVKI
jgi:hypothetical protein